MIEVHTKKQVRKKRLIPVAFPEFNQQSWHDKLQTPQSQEKNVKIPILELEKRLKFACGRLGLRSNICLSIFQIVFFSTRRLL